MAIDRNKIAQQAERLVVQGKIPEAIAHYEMLVRDNPRDMNTINKIGDLYSRLGRKREAVLQFNKIGEFYAKDGFYLKAIAIYKKITKLDPSHLDTYQRLADLYAQQGLVLEARSQYQMVAEQYLRAGETRKAVGAYQALVRVDPDNLKHRSHLADLLSKDGHPSEAAEEYARLGAELERKGHAAEARTAYQKASTIQPDSPAVVAKLAAARAASGDVEGGIKLVKEILHKPGDHKELPGLLADLHMKAGQLPQAEDALAAAIAADQGRADLRIRLARVRLEMGRPAAAYEVLDALPAAPRDPAAAADLIPLLEKIQQHPDGPVEALVKLADLYAARKDEAGVTRCGQRALDLCLERKDYAAGVRHGAALLKLRPADRALKEKIEKLQAAQAPRDLAPKTPPPAQEPVAPPIAAAAPGRVEMPFAPELANDGGDLSAVGDLPARLNLEPEDEDFIAEHMTEADVFVKYGLGDRAVEQLMTVVERYPGYVPALMKLKEIHIEEGNREGARRQMAALVRAHLSAGDDTAAGEALSELKRFDPNCREIADLTGVVSAEAPGPAPRVAQATMAPGLEASEDILSFDEDPPAGADAEVLRAGASDESEQREPGPEDFADVDLYLGKGLREEAVAALRKLAESFGSHPEIVARMRAAMVAAPAAGSSAPPSVAPPFDAESGDHEEFEISLEDEEAGPAHAPAESHASLSRGASATDGLADFSDLATEVDAALMGAAEKDAALVAGAEAAPEGSTLEEIVQAFKKGIEQQVGAEDFDTHYNLGIAYKEMGLLDEAIGEFQYASKEPRILADCCSMLGICFKEKGMSTLAVKWYRRGLQASSSVDEESLLGLRYDLAELLTEMGETREALDLFTEVFGINSKYRDVSARIKDLERQLAR